MDDAVRVVRDALIQVSRGEADQPARLALRDASALAMMARGSADSGTAMKLVSVRPENGQQGLPTIHALGVWFDAATGAPSLLIDGAALTSLRTGAASGVATDLLADPDASVLSVIGAGAQAADQVRAVCTVRPIEHVRVVSRGGISASALVAELAAEMPRVAFTAVSSVSEAVRDADVLCCATTATEPVLFWRSDFGRLHVNAIGSHREGMREVASEVLKRASLIAVDEIHAARTEAGEIIDALATNAISASALVEIGELALNPPVSLDGVTIFKSVGIAMQDWAVARLLNDRLLSADGASEPRVVH